MTQTSAPQRTENRQSEHKSAQRPGPKLLAERDRQTSAGKILFIRIALLAALLAIWQWLTDVPGVRSTVHFMSPVFISSPSRVGARLWDLTTGAGGTPLIWHAFEQTVVAALIGTAIGVVLGLGAGVLLSNNQTWERALRPLIVAINAIPRIAIVPVIIIIVNSAQLADVATAITVVFFLIFFNAFEGGCSVANEVVDNARILGARHHQIMVFLRMPYAIAWSFAVLPNAIAYGLLGTVLTEILTGASGMGELLSQALDTVDSTLLFSLVVLLAATGVILTLAAGSLRKIILPWWNPGGPNG